MQHQSQISTYVMTYNHTWYERGGGNQYMSVVSLLLIISL